MLPFGVTIPATVPQGSEIPEGLMNNPVYIYKGTSLLHCVNEEEEEEEEEEVCIICNIKNSSYLSQSREKYAKGTFHCFLLAKSFVHYSQNRRTDRQTFR